uniref:Phosphodiesterase n=1 Tax=Ascaris lumbricoides TaxID=6252 RepID=A0A9J2P4E4_ASCLU
MAAELREETVVSYLRNHPHFLENYVTGPNISKETFHRWATRRSAKVRNDSRKVIGGPWLADDLSQRSALIGRSGNNAASFLFELACSCAQFVHTEQFEVYLHKDGANFLLAREDDIVVLKRPSKARKAPAHTQKLIDCAGVVLGEINFYRIMSDRDRLAVRIICTWGCVAFYFAKQLTIANGNSDESNDTGSQQRKLNAFLLDVAKYDKINPFGISLIRSIFQDIVSMDTVIMKVMFILCPAQELRAPSIDLLSFEAFYDLPNFAQKLTNADRASLFLVDQKTNELYARIFDVGTGDEEHVKINEDGHKEIRQVKFPAGKGIGGYVASTGQGLNIEDAYEDPRFNKEIDQKTGYKTRNILCMPIFIRGSVIGVVQMVNKNDGSFTKQDESSFETFAVYCGLALHHAKLYDRIKRSEQKYRVALEVLAYHSVCNKDEVNKLKSVKLRDRIVELETFDFNGMKLSELEKPLYAVYMFKSLFDGVIRYDYDDLVRFVLTVRKNYRRVAYHNWAHGWSVAHAMFALALYVACICHDLDHRGKNNAYMKTMSTPLAAVYSTSVMEHHHFNQTVTILQQDGHNILKSLSSDEYKRALSLIKHCILATDLALFFPNKARLSKIVAENSFDWQNNEHRALTQAVLMTGCDLIASAKPWAVQTETVKVIFEEFYEQQMTYKPVANFIIPPVLIQGDAERMNGKEPIAMMDRQKAHELPQMQVGFMNGICMPCYELLSRVIPETDQLKERCR